MIRPVNWSTTSPNRYIRYRLLFTNYNRTQTVIFDPNLLAYSLFVFGDEIRLKAWKCNYCILRQKVWRGSTTYSVDRFDEILIGYIFHPKSSLHLVVVMPENSIRYPNLAKHYQRFLSDENSAQFIKVVSDEYMIGTLSRLFENGDRVTRRAAILAIGFLGDFSCNETIGRALSDSDRAVRLLAEHNIRQLWCRQGSPSERGLLIRLESLNGSNQSEDVVRIATQMLDSNNDLGEAFNQRAIAYSAIGDFENSIQDCQQTLQRNRFHFPAAVGMGQGYLKINDAFTALDCFRLAIDINPDLDCLRGQIRKLERMLDGN